jgi:glycosyltransferase involved in cell wall biosynthesis
MGKEVVVVSEEGEQYPCLHTELEDQRIKYYRTAHLSKSTPLDLLKGTKDIASILRTHGPFDIILGGGVREGPKILMAKKYSDNKSINLSVIGSLPEKRYECFIAGAIYNMFYDKNVTLCDFTRKQMIRLGVKDSKIITVPLFAPDLEWFDKAEQSRIDLEAYNLQDVRKSEPIIFYAASHYYHKGFEYYLMAAYEVLKNNNATFILGGKGPLTQYLKRLAKRLKIDKSVIFTGWISNYHMPYILSNIADICVSTSLVEQLPSYVMECMAAKKPIVAASVGGIPELIVDGVNGYLVPPKDPASMANSILKLINDPDNAREMGLRGRQIVEKEFNMTVAISKLEKHLCAH